MTTPAVQDVADFASLISRLPAEQQDGITAAREVYNQTPDSAWGVLDTNAQYWCFVFARACASYASHDQ